MVAVKMNRKIYLMFDRWLVNRVNARCRKCFPVTAELRKQLNEAILGAYAAEKEKAPPAKESTAQKLREGAKEAKSQPAPAGEKTAPKKSDPEL